MAPTTRDQELFHKCKELLHLHSKIIVLFGVQEELNLAVYPSAFGASDLPGL